MYNFGKAKQIVVSSFESVNFVKENTLISKIVKLISKRLQQ